PHTANEKGLHSQTGAAPGRPGSLLHPDGGGDGDRLQRLRKNPPQNRPRREKSCSDDFRRRDDRTGSSDHDLWHEGRGKGTGCRDPNRRNQANGHYPPVLFLGAGAVSSEGKGSGMRGNAANLRQGNPSTSPGIGDASAGAGKIKASSRGSTHVA